ncbi:hypothetical protein PP914_gp204 [Arthrobacter phage Qui]|jgi:hypothetical protein|uniref:Uncharacterized protein n=1 Tax=Arthrobacter phage Qui TaxID=2603260 RepID=A0A5B8WM46_9CAUD|nr:hypothetical protein PP914_gp204 [Arthrobacter phage Qui]QED11692.1 hypothetical protein SEA_QUI_204 [Arthrobacter phage Qui]QOC56523.1 hypothetical protein SEA_PAELLA_204 [Arthrobacter phage Paella]
MLRFNWMNLDKQSLPRKIFIERYLKKSRNVKFHITLGHIFLYLYKKRK